MEIIVTVLITSSYMKQRYRNVMNRVQLTLPHIFSEYIPLNVAHDKVIWIMEERNAYTLVTSTVNIAFSFTLLVNAVVNCYNY